MQPTKHFCVVNKKRKEKQPPSGNYERQRHKLADVFKVKGNSFQPVQARRGVNFSRYSFTQMPE